MFVKIHKHKNKDLGAIARCSVAVAHEEYGGAHQVTALIRGIDCFDFPTVVASLRLSPAETRALAEQLNEAAHAAEVAEVAP